MERNLLAFLSLPFDDGADPSSWKRLEGFVRFYMKVAQAALQRGLDCI